MKVILPLAVVIAVLLFFGVGGVNSLVRQDEDVNAAWAQVQNQYQRRMDLIPNLVNTVKGYATHEKETLEGVVAARSQATQIKVDAADLTPEKLTQYQKAQGAVTSALGKLLAITENYPDLKANQNFLETSSSTGRNGKPYQCSTQKTSMMLHKLITSISAVSRRISLQECSASTRKHTLKQKKEARKLRR